MMSEENSHKKKPKGRPVEFSHESLKDWVTGFRKRKQKRREHGAIQLAKKQREERNAARKEVSSGATNDATRVRRDAMKLTDRLTGAFGEKHADDSDDELGHGVGQNPEEFEEEQKERKEDEKKEKEDAKRKHAAAARHEDEEAVVTVVTRENDDDDDMANGDDDEDGYDSLDDDNDIKLPSAKASSTAYNPSSKHQANALLAHRAKASLKAKDKAAKKGIRGGHAFKRKKISSKKKKTKFGSKKGANRVGEKTR